MLRVDGKVGWDKLEHGGGDVLQVNLAQMSEILS